LDDFVYHTARFLSAQAIGVWYRDQVGMEIPLWAPHVEARAGTPNREIPADPAASKTPRIH
jgi:hypothetical protein